MHGRNQTVTAAPDALLTLGEVQERLGIARSSLYRLIDQEAIDIVEVGGRRMVEPAALAAFIAANRRSARGEKVI